MRDRLEQLLHDHQLPESLQKQFRPLFEQIATDYQLAGQQQELLERSLEITSQELILRNQQLKQHIDELEQAKSQLQHSLTVLDTTFDATGEAIIVMDCLGRLIKTNHYANSLLGDENTPKHGQAVDIIPKLTKILRQLKSPYDLIHQIRYLSEEPDGKIFGLLESKDATVYEYHSLPQFTHNKLSGRVWCFRNITEVKRNEALVRHHAFHDNLTSLPNRILLGDRIRHAVSLAKRHKSLVAVLFIDLDHFKKVNDSVGHHQGDLLLCEFVKRIQLVLREHDTIARIGGDEFVVVLENIGSYHFATDICQRILECVGLPFHMTDQDFHVSTSLGVSIFPRDADKSEELLRKAELAMYHAKSLGRNNYQYFNEELEDFTLKQIDIENRLRTAIDNDELCLYYQPKIDLKSCKVVGIEALLRWIPDDSPPIPPSEFIEIAEQSGLIFKIGRWVVNRVCQQLAEWKQLGLDDFVVSLNLSTQELRDEQLVYRVMEHIDNYGISGRQLEIEITETMFMEDIDAVQQTLLKLQGLGITISVDDFGTGYSSMRYLQRLPIDYLKIDKSFVLKLSETEQDEAIIKSVISLGHNLRIKIVAEGVEDRVTALYLSEIDCDIVQGYYFYRPLPVDQITKVLQGNRLVEI